MIHGADDELTPPENARMIAARIPGAQLEIRAGMRHGYFLEDPDAGRLVIRFLSRHGLSR